MLAQYYTILKDLIQFKTISSDPYAFTEMQGASRYLQTLFDDHGWEVEVVSGYGNPIVLASYRVSAMVPTCILYGHYDVQYADMSEGWKHDPFSLYLGKDKVYGRGVADNKGQFLIHLISLFDLAQHKKLGYNVIVVLEGGEEIGSPGFEKFLLEYKDKIQADFTIISDSSLIGDYPCIDAGYRGSCNVKLILKTATTDVHSGEYGGLIPNAVHEASVVLSKLFDDHHRVTIPYFYYNVEQVPVDVVVRHKKIKIDIEKIKTLIGVKTVFVDKEFDHLTQVGLRPTIQVTGIQGGYVGDGFKNAIPSQAIIHMNLRTVKNQRVDDVIHAFEQRLKVVLPEYVFYDLQASAGTDAVKINLEGKYVKRAEMILKNLYGKNVLYKYVGGSLPIITLFADILGTENLLVPLANEDCTIHGVNENLDIACIQRGFDFSRTFFSTDGSGKGKK